MLFHVHKITIYYTHNHLHDHPQAHHNLATIFAVYTLVFEVSVQPPSVYSQLALDANMVAVVFPAVYMQR